MTEDARKPILVLSPHFDDAVLSCARFIAQHSGAVTVATVMGGKPSSWNVQRRWDFDECGIPVGTDVIELRKTEDRRALELLGASQLAFDVRENEYEPDDATRPAEVRSAVEKALEGLQPATCVIPLGTGHPDHQLVTVVAVDLARADVSDRDWLVYEEQPYRTRFQKWNRAAIEQLYQRVPTLEPCEVVISADIDLKGAAIDCYASQAGPLKRGRPVLPDCIDESYWRLV